MLLFEDQPLHRYSRFRSKDGYKKMGMLCGILVLVAAVALAICLCKGKMPSCGRSGKMGHSSSSPVQIESHDHMKKVLSSSDVVGVMFYATWCGHCKTTKPHFEKAAQMSGVPCCLVECEKVLTASHMEEYGIVGYPMIVRFDKGRIAAEHAGAHTPEALAGFLKA